MKFQKYIVIAGIFGSILFSECLVSPNNVNYKAQMETLMRKSDQELDAMSGNEPTRDFWKALRDIQLKSDKVKAFEFALKAAYQGLPDAETLVGSLYLDNKDYSLAFAWLQSAARHLNGHAILLLTIEASKDGFEKIDQQEPKWRAWIATKEFADLLHKAAAADRKDDDAEYVLGKWYYDGINLAKDTKRGLEYLQRSADDGNNIAKNYLGRLYARGDNVIRPNVEKAIAILSSSTAVPARMELARIYAKDEKYKDVTKAEKILQGLCDRNHAFSCINLAYLLMGEHDPAQDERIFDLLQKAYNLNEPGAAFNLAQMYQEGRVVEADLAKANQLYKEVLQVQHPYLNRFKGFMFEHGIGVPKDLEKAKEFYRSRATQEPEAKALFDKLVDKEFGISKPAKNKKKIVKKGSSSTNPQLEEGEPEELSEIGAEIDIAGDALMKALNNAISYKDGSVITDIDSSTGAITIFNPRDKSHVIITLGSLKRITDKDLKDLRQFTYDTQKSSKGRVNVAEWLSNDPALLHAYPSEKILRHAFAQRVDELIQLYGEKAFYLKDNDVVIKNKRIAGKIIAEDGKEYGGFFEYDFYDDPKKGKVLYHRFLHPNSKTYTRSK